MARDLTGKERKETLRRLDKLQEALDNIRVLLTRKSKRLDIEQMTDCIEWYADDLTCYVTDIIYEDDPDWHPPTRN